MWPRHSIKNNKAHRFLFRAEKRFFGDGMHGRHDWYWEKGMVVVQMFPGDVIHIPANVKHWHGAAADSWFAYLAFEIPGENASNEWLEPVTDAEYDKLEAR